MTFFKQNGTLYSEVHFVHGYEIKHECCTQNALAAYSLVWKDGQKLKLQLDFQNFQNWLTSRNQAFVKIFKTYQTKSTGSRGLRHIEVLDLCWVWSFQGVLFSPAGCICHINSQELIIQCIVFLISARGRNRRCQADWLTSICCDCQLPRYEL